MRKTVLSAGLVVALAGAANGQVFVFEGHLSPGVADFLPPVPTFPGGLTSMDVFDYTPADGFDNDSFIGAFSSVLAPIGTDDDDGPGFLSGLDYFAPDVPNTMAVTGFGDPDFDGTGHVEDFDYRAVITVGPTLFDAGGNDTHGTAQPVVADAIAIGGFLGVGELDFYSFSAKAGAMLTFSVADFSPDVTDNDSYIGLFDGVGTLLETDDDDGGNFLSAHHFIVPSDGTYVIAITGFGDTGFVGAHGEDFEYVLTITGGVPAPASLALLGLGGLVAGRRRR